MKWQVFFEEGIRFQCTRCGICCTGEEGIVYVYQDEAEKISSFLDIPLEVLSRRMLDPFMDGYSIREAEEGRCIFYENGCVIYPVRPLQCMTFPFWFQNMCSISAWEETRLSCHGIGKGRLFSRDEIISIVHASHPIYLKVMQLVYK